MRILPSLAALTGLCLALVSTSRGECEPDTEPCGNGATCPNGTTCSGPPFFICSACCEGEPCCDCPGPACEAGVCESGCSVAQFTKGSLPGACSGTVTFEAGSILTLSGSAVQGSSIDFAGDGEFAALYAFDQGSVAVSGGVIGGVGGFGNSTVSATGGQIMDFVQLHDAAMGTIQGITIGREMEGSFVAGTVELQDQSQLQVTSVIIGQDVSLSETSQATLMGATIHGQVSGLDETILNFTGGSVAGPVTGYHLTMSGTPVGANVLVTGAGSTLAYSGGLVMGNVEVRGAGATGQLSSAQVMGNVSVPSWLGVPVTMTLNNAELDANLLVGSEANVSMTGGSIAAVVSAELGSTLEFDNVHARGILSLGENVDLTFDGGRADNIVVISDGTTVTVSGGAVFAGPVYVLGGTLNFSNSQITGEELYVGAQTSRATLSVTNSTINAPVTIREGTDATLTATSIGADLTVFGEGDYHTALSFHGGTISGKLNAQSDSDVTVTGGAINGMYSQDSSMVLVQGGTFKGGQADGTSTIDARGGAFNFPEGGGPIALVANDGSTIKLSENVAINGKLVGWRDSRIEMSGGTAGQGAEITDRATLVLSGGNVHGGVTAGNATTLLMTAGHITGALLAGQTDPGASFTVEGGQIDERLSVFDNSKVTFSGGTILGLASAADMGMLTLTGGSIGTNVEAYEDAVITLAGMPSIAGSLKAEGDSTINAAGGTVQGATASETAKLNLSGIFFSAGDVTGSGDSALTMTGGTVGGDLILSDMANIEMSGGIIEGHGLTQGSAYLGLTGGRINGRVESANTDPEFGGLDISGGVVGGNFISRGVRDSLRGTAVVEGNLFCGASSITFIRGGTVHATAVANQSGQILMEGGVVNLDLEVQNNASVFLDGGVVARDLQGFNNGKAVMSGGVVQGNLECFDTSTITRSGGLVFGQSRIKGQCTINFSGMIQPPAAALGENAPLEPESFDLNLIVDDSATVKFIGTGLSATLVDSNYLGEYSLYELSGQLADGTTVTAGQFQVRNLTGAQYRLLPYVRADLDFDGDVDAEDAVVFQDCDSGAAVPVAPGCEKVDFDEDGDGDATDFAILQRCIRGPDMPVDTDCAD